MKFDKLYESMKATKIVDISIPIAKLTNKWADTGLKIFISNRGYNISVEKIIVPADKRGTGMGTEFMKELIDLADKENAVISLSPSTEFGAKSMAKLLNFYKKLGFIENKGKNKDYTISDTYYRPLEKK
jgi:predicted GNAT family N-acyltransferase